MGALVGLLLGVGLVLVASAFALPRPSGRRERPARTARGEQLLRRAGLDGAPVGGLVASCAAAALVAGLAAQLLTRTPPVSLAFALLAGYLPVAVLAARARKRERERAELWPEVVDNLASAVRAGMSLPEALAAVGDRGPEQLRPAFAAFGIDYQVTGRFGGALDALQERLADPVGDRVVESLRLARDVGGAELGPLLRRLSTYLREDARTRSELESRQAWTVNGARLAVSAPWLVLLLLSFQREVITRYASPGGVVVLAVGGALCLAAYRLMLRIGRLPRDKRILARAS